MDHPACCITVANVVSMGASEGANVAGAFGAQKPKKGMFRTVGQLYKVSSYVYMLVVLQWQIVATVLYCLRPSIVRDMDNLRGSVEVCRFPSWYTVDFPFKSVEIR